MSSVHVCVRQSVTFVDQDHIRCKSWKLIAQTITPTPSLFVTQRPSTYFQGNMGKVWGDYRWVTGDSSVQEHKSGNISETQNSNQSLLGLPQEWVKVRTSNSRYRSEQKSIKNVGKISRGCSHAGTLKNFQSTHIGYRAHRAVIFAIARLSCYLRLRGPITGYVLLQHSLFTEM